jgi:hypothetical protein
MCARHMREGMGGRFLAKKNLLPNFKVKRAMLRQFSFQVVSFIHNKD